MSSTWLQSEPWSPGGPSGGLGRCVRRGKADFPTPAPAGQLPGDSYGSLSDGRGEKGLWLFGAIYRAATFYSVFSVSLTEVR